VTLVTAAPVGGGDVARLFHLVLDRLNSPTSKAMYRRALLDFLGWSQAQPAATFDKAAVQRYRPGAVDDQPEAVGDPGPGRRGRR